MALKEYLYAIGKWSYLIFYKINSINHVLYYEVYLDAKYTTTVELSTNFDTRTASHAMIL